MGYPTKPANSATAINRISPDSQFVIYNLNADDENIVWYTGEVDSDGYGKTTSTVPSGCSTSEIKAKKDQLNTDRAKALLRVERDKRLAETDWWDLSDTTPITDAQKKYRQDLRDLPSTQNPTVTGSALSNVTWPTKP